MKELSRKVLVIILMILLSLLVSIQLATVPPTDVEPSNFAFTPNKESATLLQTSEIDPNLSIAIRQIEAAFKNVATTQPTDVDSTSSTAGSQRDRIPNEPNLRFQWTNLELHSDLAKLFHAHQHNCSIPIAAYKFRYSYGKGAGYSRNFGLGSDLHVWSFHALYAMNLGLRIRTPMHSLHWAWWDQEACKETSSSSLLACYFPDAETSTCSTDETFHNSTVFTLQTKYCGPQKPQPPGKIEQGVVALERTAMAEYLFSNVSPLVVEEATNQLQSIFSNGTVPPNLITIHVRWGDKKGEMQLKAIEDYIKATEQVVKEKHIDTVNILLCTEDPAAVDAFTSRMPKNWNVYLDQFYTKMLPYRAQQVKFNDIVETSFEVLKGKAGLWALGSLLVAMEANIFILTTASNWSRLMNEIRMGIVNPRCNDCTTMVDLGYGDC